MKHIIHTLVLCAIAVYTAPQAAARYACAGAKQRSFKRVGALAKGAASPLEELYDVQYLKLDLSLSDQNIAVSGATTTRAVVVGAAGMSSYAFELSGSLIIDSFKMNGVTLSVSTPSPDLRVAALPAALNAGATFTAQVFYHGAPPLGTGFFSHAMNHYSLGIGAGITFTLSDPGLSKEWWPTKQTLTDKIDSADLWFTVPAGTRAGSNGRLMNVSTMSSGALRYEWKTRYPIDYYLISASVAPYVEHNQTLHFSGSADTMPIQQYIYDTATFLPANGAAIDSLPYMVDYFSSLYGRYPFWKEKYGMCVAPLSGGMEHQTMTTIGNFATTTIAHELGHQWWGDCVTNGSWLDIWLSEGWAAYTEQLYVEHFWGMAPAQSYRTSVFNRVMAKPGGTVMVDDTTDAFRIFDSRLTYDKGAAVAHMLRYLAPGGDSVFFAGLRAYQQRYAYRTAVTDSLKEIMEAVYGRRLDTFFNQWVRGEGFPTYAGNWNQRGDDVYVQLTQTTSMPGSVAAFAMPLALQLKSPAGDTTVKVYFNSAQQTYRFTWSNAMTGFVIDPRNDVVNRVGAIQNDPALGVSGTTVSVLRIYPNPAMECWHISGIPQGATLTLTDATGKTVWQRADAPLSTDISSNALPAGIYTLQVKDASGAWSNYKLERQ